MSRTDRSQSAGERLEAVSAARKAPGRSGQRASRRRCALTKPKGLRNEVEKQFGEAAAEIVRAQVEKAKAGSLQHTKWLCSLVDQREAGVGGTAVSLSEMLMRELKGKQ